jgi:hypothetical protein
MALIRGMTTKLLVAAPLLISSLAAANTVASDGAYAKAADKTETRIEGRVGMLIGGSDVGDADGFAMGVSAGLGYRIGDVTLRGLFDHYKTGDGADEAMDRRGRGTRVGGAVRYSFAASGDKTDKGIGLDFWGEVGFGMEHVAWRTGGVLDRPSGELAVGFELDGRGERDDRTARRRHIGYFMAFRSLIAEGPEMGDVPATCGGPCSRATKPSRTDISMFFELGLHWGH